MKKLVIALLLMSLVLTGVQPAEAASVKDIGAKFWRMTKKGFWLPVYMVGGAGAGVVVWIHYGGEEGKLADLFAGAKKK